MKSFMQLLYRIGDVMTIANTDNRFEFERLMSARRERELAGVNKSESARSPVPAPCRTAPSRRLRIVDQPAGRMRKRVRESMA